MLIIKGNNKLSGVVKVSGSKNAALPIIGASLLLAGKVKLNNVPKIGDVKTFLDILENIGVVYSWEENTLFLDATNLNNDNLNFEKIKKIRSSIFLLSPLLYFFKSINIPFPGGCKIGKRPIDAHLNGLKAIGYDYELDGDNIKLNGETQSGDKILNAGFGVSSTENLIVANVLRNGKTTIKNSAIEPHVMNLISFMREAGANIDIRYNHEIIITGVEKLASNLEFDIVSDYIEAGTYMVIAALVSEKYLDIKDARIEDLYTFIEKLKDAGVVVEDLGDDTLRVYRAENLKPVSFQTNIFPGFPTDLQSPFAILQSQAFGTSRIHEVLFEGRLNFLVELEKMTAKIAILNPHEAIIFGPNKLKGTTVTSWDLRAGMAMIIAGLIAEGETKVTNVEYIYRGYENFVEKLKNLGADITEEENS
ncbi:UDP-N-acetylglucosamine 1-carboxyvinyltransferase [Candidatus Gracilibacteria bacterium HOT-871]|nr:UDP-N-acetylglucosamine 1-carboxyvinyltransferase [Candidatus Gracilibacteria bacterium HOT-871]RKW22443.1 MAG: UDP-N-acetylglucosamine 1-carboxyvinyltransferase [Candidatus Gracilibacteria bacterium]